MSFVVNKITLILLLSCCVACEPGGDDDSSSNQDGVDTEAPTAVSNIIDTSNFQSVTLVWDAASDNIGIDHYQITRDGGAIGTTATTTFTDNSVTENTQYTYHVVAVDAAGNATSSDPIAVSVPANTNPVPDTEPPTAVSNLTATTTTQSVSLSWNAATDNLGIAHYQITRDGMELDTTTTTSYTDARVSVNTDYIYHVIAYDAAGNNTSSAALTVSVPANNPSTSVKAFPSAEGFGANASGGRNGEVIKVTNLNLSGVGSLQAALDIDAPRIIVFEVSGVIEGDIVIPYGDVTIAGQTAPGAGITIHGRLTCQYSNPPDNIIVRHLRVRADHSTNPSVAGNQYDGIQCSRSSNLIFDHVSASGGLDETFDIFEATDLTVQWSTITRADTDGHPEGVHNYGLISGPNGANVSIHHNLFAHNGNRNPAVATGPAEIINNLVYNARHGFVHHNPASGDFNIIGNYYKQGPDNTLIPFFFDDENSGGGTPAPSYYLQDNYVDDPGDFVGSVDNPWLTPHLHSSFENIDWGWDSSVARADQKHTFSQAIERIDDALTNYDLVLSEAGAFPRDLIDSENVQEVNAGTGSWGTRIPADLMQGLSAGSPPIDSDGDGMPDDWENSRGLSSSTDDHNTIMASGYTAIEVYINELADQLLTATNLSTSSSPTLDANVDAVTVGNWYRPGVDTTWAWQLQGALNTSYGVDVYDIDLFDTSAADIASLHAAGHRVICYFSAGSYESWRSDAGDFQSADLGNTLSGYADERWLDIRSSSVFTIMLDRLDLAASKGCDGVEPDNVMAYQENSGFNLTASDQLAFNRNLYNAAHQRGLAVALKNDLDQVSDLIDYVDMAVNEQCHQYSECHFLAPFISAGKPVLNAEYLASYRDNPNTLCADALQANIRTLILSVELDDSFNFNCDTDYP